MSDKKDKCIFCKGPVSDSDSLDLEGNVYCRDGICQEVKKGRDICYIKRNVDKFGRQTQVDITTVNQFKDYLAWVNSLDLEDIQLVDRGRPVRVMEGAVEEFKFTGLSNVDFIRCEFYKPGEELTPDDTCPIDDMRDPCSKRCMKCEHNCGTVEDKDGHVEAIRCEHYKFERLRTD